MSAPPTPPGEDLEFQRLPVTPGPPSQRAAILADPVFGRTFTDHMVTARYTEEAGWHGFTVGPFRELPLSPATSALHYGQAIFEGLKAYRQPDGSVALFRPELNAARFAASAARIAMPPLPRPAFLASLGALLEADHAWVPDGADRTLYLRPLMIATDEAVVAAASRTYLFALFASPAGAYFDGGIRALRVWVERDQVRAARGGTGAAKFAGNYGAGLLAQKLARERGCDQVIWLDPERRRFVEELGAMNLFLVAREEGGDVLLTPPLSDSLLAGVTRDSIIGLARDGGMTVREEPIAIERWQDGARDGTIREAFACGTAVAVAPIGSIHDATGHFVIGDGQPGPVTLALGQRLLDLQFGRAEDTHGWRHTAWKAS
ncbi:branched-chain amino acid aminotransferase [Actinomadura sp. KC06]|uniref:branched-chain amino acid aminotransferase n=1 Tax=Actinomadura sp. KC06 TaxID=2530369 RepID=UPI00104A6AB3|nr:branched-chain amino acid aminotransferase [Actinomadura sp. KC06]TDD38177.1 branched-chain amino acid aminotransferase [Actinomadura sp. KC06]